MSDTKNWVGLVRTGGEPLKATGLQGNEVIVVIAENREALGTRLNDFCFGATGIPNEPGDDLINVVVGDPWLLVGVKLVARGFFRHINLPKEVREMFSVWCSSCTEIAIFENKDRSRVYAAMTYAVPLEEVIDEIDKKFLVGI